MTKMNPKDPTVLYLDQDTEITEAVEKVKKTTGAEVRVVAPTRSGLLQSSVNMRLLKKAAEEQKKELVLVTNDNVTKNLAAGAGIAIASSVKALAYVPELSKELNIPKDIKIEVPEDTTEAEESTQSRFGGKKISGFKHKHISLDEETGTEEKTTEEAVKKAGKDKRVPDFNKLNKRIWLIMSAIGFLIILLLSYVFIPTAKVILITEAKKGNLDFDFILDTTTSSSDSSAKLLAAKKQELTKDAIYEISATGKKDVGTKAGGAIAIKNCEDTNPHPLPAGSKVTSNGKNFTTNSAITIPAGEFSGGGSVCNSDTISVNITATENGESYNLGAATFSIAGLSNKITGTGSTGGGTSRTITVLSDQDILTAKAQAETQTASAKEELLRKINNDQFVFESTMQTQIISFTTSVPVDSEADKVTVNAKVQYSILTANRGDVNQLFDNQVRAEIRGDKQIYQNGAEEATFKLVKQLTAEKVQLNATASAYYGDPIDNESIKKEVAGKPKKEVSEIIQSKGEQITGAQVESFPALIPWMPLLSGKITVDIKVSTQ